METVSAGGVVLNSHGQVLVVSQHNTSWSLPKGHVERGETLLEAAEREICEESGVTELALVRKLGSYQRSKMGRDGTEDHSENKTIHMFLFTTTQEELQPRDAHNPEARWVDKEDVVMLLTHKKDKNFFLKVKDEL